MTEPGLTARRGAARRPDRAHHRDAGRHQRQWRHLRRLGDVAHGSAGGIAGVDRAQGRVVTIAVDAMTFIRPVKVGDVLSVYTQIESVGRTSMKIHVEAWARRFRTTLHEKVTDATFTFVAIDEEGRPRPVPKLPEG